MDVKQVFLPPPPPAANPGYGWVEITQKFSTDMSPLRWEFGGFKRRETSGIRVEMRGSRKHRMWTAHIWQHKPSGCVVHI